MNRQSDSKHEVKIAITAASYSGNKGAAAMLQSSISQLKEKYGSRLGIYLMSVYPAQDRVQCPHRFVTVVATQPFPLMFLAFPCAVLYKMCGWCPPFQKVLLHNKILQAYRNTDLVIDEAGIAFSDSRGWMMNTYAFACAAVPMLMGVPVVKYSQALGPFCNGYNRFLAKCVLSKMKLIVARGRFTYEHLHAIGMQKQARLYADGAFTMPPAPLLEQRAEDVCKKAGLTRLAAVSVSSVVARRCQKAGIAYSRIMAEFIDYLLGQGYAVWLFANAARMHSRHPRNNDLMTGDAVMREYEKLKKRGKQKYPDGFEAKLVWERREMDAEEIRAYIRQSDFLIASRFHAMVFALTEQVPVLMIGWSHKYQEVMEQFGLGSYAADYSSLSTEQLKRSFEEFLAHQQEIRRKIKEKLPAVQKSSEKNIRHIVKILDQIKADQGKEKQRKTDRSNGNSGSLKRKRYMNHVIDLDAPQRYMGNYLSCRMGYAADAGIRQNAASGGMVTALLCSLLKNGEIDGAWVVRTAFTKDGRLTYQTGIAQSVQQICEASSSVYMSIPMLAHLDDLRAFDGRLAVVLTPCMMRAFCQLLEREEELRKKIVLKIGLFCSGAHDVKLTECALDKLKISRQGAKRLYYRRGHWRGRSGVLYEDGSEKEFSYTRSVCAYKNAYFFVQRGCLQCKDQFAACADISFGDVWLREVKKDTVKYTGCIIRSKNAYRMLLRAQAQGEIYTRPLTAEQALRSQARALTFKYRGQRWNHRLAGWLAVQNREFSSKHEQLLRHVPLRVIYYYMCAIRVLLSW